MVALSQYTYAMLFMAAIVAVEGIALAVRAASRAARGPGCVAHVGRAAAGCLPSCCASP